VGAGASGAVAEEGVRGGVGDAGQEGGLGRREEEAAATAGNPMCGVLAENPSPPPGLQGGDGRDRGTKKPPVEKKGTFPMRDDSFMFMVCIYNVFDYYFINVF